MRPFTVRAILIARVLLICAFCAFYLFFFLGTAWGETAAGTASAAEAADPRARYQPVKLVELVPATRIDDGSRIIFEPRPVRFTARLAQLPSPQKADYLKQVMGMMGAAAELQVSQRVALDYGGDKLLAAYVEDRTATRIGKELQAGDERTFYAFHVYNNRHGPALVITSFEEQEK
jgi:hypothetical protein